MGFFQAEAILLLFLLIACLAISSWLLQKNNILPKETIERSSPLDGLRGVLALSVLAHHFYITYIWKTDGSWEKPQSVLIDNFGAVAVSFFFLITGFLFISKVQKGNIDWKKLYISRVKRIAPLFYFAFSFVLILTLINEPVTSKNIYDYSKWFMDWLMFKGEHFNSFESRTVIAGVDWTLNYEWKFYFALPLIFFIWHGKINKYIAALIIIWLLFYIFKNKSNQIYALFLFAIPVVIYKEKLISQMQVNKKVVNTIIGISTISALFFMEAYSIIQMVTLAIAFAFIAHGYSFNNILNNKGLKVLGEISYSIYLMHGIVLYMAFSVFEVIDLKSITLYQYYMFFPLIFSAVVLTSLITYHCIESPFLRKNIKHASLTSKVYSER